MPQQLFQTVHTSRGLMGQHSPQQQRCGVAWTCNIVQCAVKILQLTSCNACSVCPKSRKDFQRQTALSTPTWERCPVLPSSMREYFLSCLCVPFRPKQLRRKLRKRFPDWNCCDESAARESSSKWRARPVYSTVRLKLSTGGLVPSMQRQGKGWRTRR